MAPITDYSRFLSARSARRGPVATISVIQPYMGLPDIISLGGGLPHPDSFPFKSVSFEIESFGDEPQLETLQVEKADLLKGLQYGNPRGAAELNQWFAGLVQRDHKPPNTTELIITGASQDGLAKTLEMLLDESSSILIEQPTYPATLNILQPLAPNFIPISIDRYGLVPTDIERVFQNWDTDVKTQGKRKPSVLYVVPCGQNPSGVNMTIERKREVYALAQKWDFLIVEDDPYYYLQFTSTHRIPSFLSLDVDGRVIRMDSLAKIISAGFDKHVEKVWRMYEERGKWFTKAVKDILESEGLGSMEEPQAGMFAWKTLMLAIALLLTSATGVWSSVYYYHGPLAALIHVSRCYSKAASGYIEQFSEIEGYATLTDSWNHKQPMFSVQVQASPSNWPSRVSATLGQDTVQVYIKDFGTKAIAIPSTGAALAGGAQLETFISRGRWV
ncbi:hypothetical protein HDU93_004068 [Gonapodya sp. JEL0774]|nr:hypothetical protein HDU93_004068 [Gonapodya sp. JEL0774]